MRVHRNENTCQLGRRLVIQGPRCFCRGTRASSAKATGTQKTQTQGTQTTRKKQQGLKIATVNVRSLTGKEVELGEELVKFGVDIAGITETKKNNTGQIQDGQLDIESNLCIWTNRRNKEGRCRTFL